MPDDIADLLLFAEIAEAGSLTAAGRALKLPKSTVSRRLQALEDRIGQRLLSRTTRKLVPTDLGEALLGRCQRLRETYAEARAVLDSRSGKRGVLRISMTSDLAMFFCADFLARFAVDHPELGLEIDLTPRKLDLVADRIDVALRVGAMTDSALVARRVAGLQRGVYASPAYLARAGTPERPEELVRHEAVLLEVHTPFAPQVTMKRGSRALGVPLSGRVVANSLGTVQRLTVEGAGIAMLLAHMAKPEVDAGRLVRLLPGWSLPTWDVYAVTPARRLLPARTRAFLHDLRRFRWP
jgi:DNA-binding transcriptional LysR family regulator